MFQRFILTVLIGAAASPVYAAQQIRITIPWRSETTLVQRLNRKGVDEVVKHRYEKAETLFYKAYLYDPADPFTLNNLGYVSELQGELDRAADYYKLAMQQGSEAVIARSSDEHLKGKPMMDALGTIHNMPMRINRINIYAMQMLSQNRPFDAKVVLKQAILLDPGNPFTLNNLGIAEQATGNLEEALKDYDAAAKTRSEQPVVVALQRSSRGKPISSLAAKSAEKLRARMATMGEQQVRAYMLTVRGVAALNRNEWPSARKDFEDAYTIDPSNAFTLNNMGYVAEKNSDLETAVSFYERARKAKDSDDSVGWANRAGVQGQPLDAVALQNHQQAAAALKVKASTPSVDTDKPIELIRRNGSSEPPANLPPHEPNPEPANPQQ